MTQEQLLQEARKEAEKVYPDTEAIYDISVAQVIKLERKAYVKGYLAKAENMKSEAVKFGRFLLKYAESSNDEKGLLCWKYEFELKNTDELYDIFIQQQIKQE